jgi:hypothetical protein
MLHKLFFWISTGAEALFLEDFDMLTRFDDFVLFFCFLVCDETHVSEILDGLENKYGRGVLTLLPTARIEPFSDLLVSMQEWHISPTLFTVETGKHPLQLLQVKYFSSGGKQRKF